MLFRKTNFEDKNIASKFHLNKLKHHSNWGHYYDCYNYCIENIVNYGLSGNYVLNSKARAILFLLRQSLELSLKNNLSLKGNEIPISHDFKDLYDAFTDKSIIPIEFKKIVEKVNFDKFGASFRYHLNKDNGKPYFTYSDKIEVAQLLETYNKIPRSIDFSLGKISENFVYNDRRKRWDFTFHLGESDSLFIIKQQYDDTIELLIDGIINLNYDIHKIYLPILFLIRHSLEIGLKENISEIQDIGDTRIESKDYSNEHSISRLFNCYDNFLSSLDTSNLDPDTKTELDKYRIEFNNLKETIHNLDVNSFYFRFPVDKNGNPHSLNITKLKLIEIIKLFYFTDPFVMFTNNVLRDFNLI